MNRKSIIMWLCANVVYCNANSVVPVTINQAQNELPDCKGECKDDNWATWTQWDICKGGECHLNEGKQTRQTICFTLVTPPPSRSDGGSKEELKREGKWLETCIEKQQRPCVRELSCSGEWTSWEKWRECEISGKSKNATCSKTRRRFCLDKKGTRQSGSHCYGGPSSDTENELCSNKSCSKIEPRIGIAEDDLIIPKKTTKQKPNILNS
uniref:properdin-like n=1 Tax=Styela clava TaxID=7725 RepID=UPI001939F252|nr:properdin-like [Styela clava]